MATQDRFVEWLGDLAQTMAESQEHLTELDSAIGDADHGSNMARGTAAVAELLDGEFPDTASLLKKAGMTLVSTVGGASGPLYGTFFIRLAGPLAGKSDVSAAELGAALRAGVDGVLQRGKAEPGDKTMYDAWAPALAAYDEAVTGGSDLGPALGAAAKAAAEGRDATGPLVARKGRASYLGERSAGHIDPGAASTTLLLESAARTLR
ncbi:dihydroxyacetone kinase subunit DhaL [Luteipulveratus mongoliensis]|uniref:Dihydroxyacetone kinase n=1 Tax=Luteipulveratus mongoliensis TaxID=571913 RepID=A0A0K1JLA7_9MICO|nr:dihydroxyacetone kinase subunit DhaL [Luteipulveratus mongoliensis]AKU17355.1 dihydroxyacetone kinase [Luteipulveratus mongoliensis]